MKDYVYNNKKKDQNLGYTLNTLIYDYLIKMKYEKSAKSFALDAQLDETKPYDGSPLLSQWYFAFSEISSVRSGLSSNPRDLSRIEGIMLKLENEKKRYQQMGRIDHQTYYGPQREPETMYKGHPMYYTPPYPDQRKMDMYGPMHPPVDNTVPFIKPEYSRVQPRPPMRYEEPIYEQSPPKGPMRPDMRYEKPKLNPVVDRQSIERQSMLDRQSVDRQSMLDRQSIDRQSVDRPFVLREISSFRITDASVIFSAISKEHTIMFNVVDSRKICTFNCATMKIESEFDTGGKQLVSIRLRDAGEYVYIVGSYGGKELMIMRYVPKEGKFDIIGYLRGHSANIISFDVSDFIYSLDESFIFRKWNFKGNCEREEILSGNISRIFSYSESTIILSDNMRVYLYDFEMNMEMQELFKGELVETKRIDDHFIFIFRDKASIMDRYLNRMKFLSIPHNGLTTGCFLENEIFLGSQQTLWYECQSRLNKVNIYESGDIIALESIGKVKNGHMVSINSIGEFKLMCKSFNE